MNALEMTRILNKTGVWTPTDTAMHFKVKVKDVRAIFGRTDVLVVPIAGSGESWVSLESVKMEAK